MKLHVLGDRIKKGMTTWGCMWPQGAYSQDASFELKSGSQASVPMQTRITAFWPDGTIKWTAHTADADALGADIEVVAAKERKALDAIQGITVSEADGEMTIDAGVLRILIDKNAEGELFKEISLNGKKHLIDGHPCLQLEEQTKNDKSTIKEVKEYSPVIQEIMVEEAGNLQCIIRYDGHFSDGNGRALMPFILRMKVGYNKEDLSFVHTFLYDGDENRDFLKGLGITFDMPMSGPLYNRHVKFMDDRDMLHESVIHLVSWQPRVPEEIYRRQMSGEALKLTGDELSLVEGIVPNMPHWSEYDLCQDYAEHFKVMKKQLGDGLCFLDVYHGTKTQGGAAFGSEQGSVIVAMKDFWEKYPSGFTFKNLDTDTAQGTIWLWSPKAEAMDFRHYATRGYNKVCYEGYDYFGATPYGIANTSEFSLSLRQAMIPADGDIRDFTENVQEPCLYVGEPEYYHDLKAFGYWSLPNRENETESWIEEQLDNALAFYEDEVEQRGWYGMFNYGDFMHTYDPVRHQWRYDIGGYAWDNTELVPTLWLWYAFLRSGNPRAFRLSEKLTRHASEVDVYHMGQYKGLGSRHNVRHWGCPCKEARIAMAAHHRFYYYMTGDRRLEDIFDELKDNEQTFYNKDPMGDFYDKEEMVYPAHARSGPDWSSLCSNWMTQWERFNDTAYRDKILQGVSDIKAAPLKLVSGPDFEFNPADVSLRYIGECASGGTHLQICMGAPQVWMEMADWMGDDEWKQMMADYGRFYFLDREDQEKESGGLIGDRQFTFPMMAAGMGAYGAWYLKDEDVARRTWQHMLQGLMNEGNRDGFRKVMVKGGSGQDVVSEIPWISTNFVAQWCLNMIMALEFIRPQLPKTLEEADKLIAELDRDGFRRA